MNLNLASRFLKEHWRSGSIVALSVILYALLIGSIAPVFLEDPSFKQLFQQYPKGLLAFLAGSTEGDLFSTEGFWSAEFLQLWWIVIVGGLLMAYAAGLVAKDMDQGTIEVVLTQPVSRVSLVLSRFAGLAVYALALVLITVVAILVTTLIFGMELKTAGLFAVGVNALIFLLTIASITLLISVIVSGRGRAVVWGVAVVLVSHLLNALGTLNETVKEFGWLSLFNYYKPQAALARGRVDWPDVLVLLAIFSVCLVLAVIIFKRKDISVT